MNKSVLRSIIALKSRKTMLFVGFFMVFGLFFYTGPRLAQETDGFVSSLLPKAKQAAAAACSTTGTGTKNWSDPTTWTNCGGTYPGAGGSTVDTVTIANAAITVNVNVSVTIASMTFTGGTSASTVSLNSGIILNVTGTTVINAPTANSITKQITTGSGTYNAGGLITLASGTGATRISGLSVDTGGTLGIGGGITFTGSGEVFTVASGATVNISGGTIGSGATTFTVNAGSTTNITGNATMGHASSWGAVNINSSTTWTLGAVAVTISGALNISGNLRTSSATGAVTFNNSVTVNSGGSLDFSGFAKVTNWGGSGNIVNNGTYFWTGTGAATFTTSTAISGSSTTYFGCNLTVNSGITLTNNGYISVGCILGGSGALTQGVNSELYLYGTGSGTTITTLNATATGNEVWYSHQSTAQTCKVTQYYHLYMWGGAAKTCALTANVLGDVYLMKDGSSNVTWTLSSAFSINGNLSIGAGTVFTTGGFALTVSGTTSVNGTLTFTNNTGVKSFVGQISVGATGSVTGASTNINIGTGIDNSGSVAVTGTVTVNTSGVSFSGANLITLGGLTVNSPGTVTNNNSLDITGTFNGSGSFTQGSGASLVLGGSTTNAAAITTLDASTNINSVNYDGGNQTCKAITYSTLQFTGTGTKTCAVSIITGDLTVGGSASYTTSANLIISGNLTNDNGTTISVSSFTIIVGGSTVIGGTLNHTGASGTKTYNGSVTLNNGAVWNNSGNANITLKGSLTLNSSSTFSSGNGIYTYHTENNGITITDNNVAKASLGNVHVQMGENVGNIVLAGSDLLFGSLTIPESAIFSANGEHMISILGSGSAFVVNGTFVPSAGTVVLMGNSVTVPATTYNNLYFSGSGTFVMPNSQITINGHFIVNSGTSVNKGSGTVVFSGNKFQAIMDNNTTAQDLGNIQISGTGSSWCIPALDCSSVWTARRQIAFDNTASGSSLTDFPVLIKLNSDRIDYSKTQANGQDIRFLDSDGVTQLSYEIEKWDPSGTSYIWVKIPQLDNTNTDYIWMYYGNPTALDNQNPAAVWSNGYQGVYHLNQTSGGSNSILDSKGLYHGTDGGSPTFNVEGVSGGGMSFNGTSSFFSIGDMSSNFGSQTGTFTLWVKRSINTSPTGSRAGSWSLNSSGQNNHYVWTDGTIYDQTFRTSRVSFPSSAISDRTQWHKVTITRNNTNWIFYQNGTAINTQAAGSWQFSNSIFIGKSMQSLNFFEGSLDEVSISNVVRTQDWIRAEYLSQSDSMATFYGEESTTSVIMHTSVKATSVTVDVGQRLILNGSNTLTLTGNTDPLDVFGVMNISTGTIEFAPSVASMAGITIPVLPYYNLKLNKADESFLATKDITILNNFEIVSGSFTAPANLIVGGDFINSGSFIHNNGNVIIFPMIRSEVNIGGATSVTSFYNFFASAGGKTLRFKEGSNFVFNGHLDAGGVFGEITSFRSMNPGQQWFITLNGTANISFFGVQDSGCISSGQLPTGPTIYNYGNNGSCWGFPSIGTGVENPPVDGGGPGGIGGPSISYLLRAQGETPEFYGTSPFVTNEITPAAGSRMLVVLSAMEVDGASDFSSSLTISDSQGLTWTPIGNVGNPSDWAIAMRAWISSPATATPTTFSFGASGRNIFGYRVSIIQIANATGVVTGLITDNNMAVNGPDTLTLTASPESSDLVFFARYGDSFMSDMGPIVMSSGWYVVTDLHEAPPNIGGFSVAVNSNLLSTTIAIDDMVSSEEYLKAIGFGFIVKGNGNGSTGGGTPGGGGNPSEGGGPGGEGGSGGGGNQGGGGGSP